MTILYYLDLGLSEFCVNCNDLSVQLSCIKLSVLQTVQTIIKHLSELNLNKLTLILKMLNLINLFLLE